MINHVAILDVNRKVWVLPKPNRHNNVIHLMVEKTGGKDAAKKLLRDHVQGFLSDTGEFLDREAAFLVALEHNQVLPPYNPTNPSQRRWDLEVDRTPRQLFSEDLW